jgi:hypothetical protein
VTASSALRRLEFYDLSGTVSYSSKMSEYNRTAQALSLPISPPDSPGPTRGAITTQRRPSAFGRNRSTSTGRTSRRSSSFSRPKKTIAKYLKTAIKTGNTIQKKVSKLPLWQQILGFVGLVAVGVLAILFLIYNEAIFGRLMPVAESWRKITGGWLILWFLTFFTAFPPMLGYSSCVTISGFVYGFPNG